VPQERLRKLTEENKELASNLKKGMDAQRRAASGKPASISTNIKKRPYGSDLTGSSARGSEDRSSAVPQPPRGTKRGREIEGIDKVSSFMSNCVWSCLLLLLWVTWIHLVAYYFSTTLLYIILHPSIT
jgi:mortality factor 4-like protein 1